MHRFSNNSLTAEERQEKILRGIPEVVVEKFGMISY
jgi:hypothetical protein